MKGFRSGGVVDHSQDATEIRPASKKRRLAAKNNKDEVALAEIQTKAPKRVAQPGNPLPASSPAAFYRQLLDGVGPATADDPSPNTGTARHRQGKTLTGRPDGAAPASGAEAAPRDQISEQNVGYKLLRAAGWREGGGLGAAEQGITSPIPAWMQSGRKGIGAPHAGMPRPVPGRTPAEDQQKRSSVDKQGETLKVAGKSKKVKRIGAEGPPQPEESVETKVKRVKQVWQAEVDAAAEAALSRYMRRAFNELDYVTESNPISRRNRLTDRNPLL